MDFKNRIRPTGWAHPLPFLQMEEEEYRELLREHGFSEHHIENELRDLGEARRRHQLPGPPEPAKKDEHDGPLDRLAKRRKRGRNHTTENA